MDACIYIWKLNCPSQPWEDAYIMLLTTFKYYNNVVLFLFHCFLFQGFLFQGFHHKLEELGKNVFWVHLPEFPNQHAYRFRFMCSSAHKGDLGLLGGLHVHSQCTCYIFNLQFDLLMGWSRICPDSHFWVIEMVVILGHHYRQLCMGKQKPEHSEGQPKKSTRTCKRAIANGNCSPQKSIKVWWS